MNDELFNNDEGSLVTTEIDYMDQGIYQSDWAFVYNENEKNVEYFGKHAMAVLIVSAVLTFCLYKNWGAITMLFSVATLIGYVAFSLKQFNVEWKKENWLYSGVMLLLALSDFITANRSIIFYNNIGIFLLFIVLLLHSFYDDSLWKFNKYLSAVSGVIGCFFSWKLSFISDFFIFKKIKRSVKKNNKIGYIILGLIITIPLSGIILLLLAGADAVFNEMLENIFVFDFEVDIAWGVGWFFVFTLTVMYSSIKCMVLKKIDGSCNETKKYEPIVAITILSPISVIYIIFSFIQIVYLFVGGKLPEGYSYASYAREGFFQLLTVCILNLFIVLLVQAIFESHIVEKILMTIVSICTYIMVASSAYRMIMYVEKYNLTELRVMVLWALLLIAILLAGVIVQIYKSHFKLFRYVVIVVSILYLGLSFSHMDYFIAKYNIYAGNTYGNHVDYYYLEHLSPDAAGVMISESIDSEHTSRFFFNIADELDINFRNFNLSRYLACENKDDFKSNLKDSTQN